MTGDSQFDFTDFSETYGKETGHLIMHLSSDESSAALMFDLTDKNKNSFGLRVMQDDIDLEWFGFNFKVLAAFVDCVRAIELLDEK